MHLKHIIPGPGSFTARPLRSKVKMGAAAGLTAAALVLGVACSDGGGGAANVDANTTATSSETASATSIRTSASNGDLSVADVVKLATPSVVRIATSEGVGSGFIIDKAGYIITNNHVVEVRTGRAAATLTVTLSDGSEYQGTVVGTDSRSDLALIKIEADQDLHALDLANLADVQVGDEVVAIGYALDLTGGDGAAFTVTSGIVSQKNRAIAEDEAILGAVQTDAAINHGNSGGPLLTLSGKVVGVNTSLQPDYTTGETAQGIGYAVGSDTIKAVYDELKANGAVDRGLLGVRGFQSLRPAQARELGLDEDTGGIYLDPEIAQVEPGGPAAAAGIQTGDVILEVDGHKVANEGELAVAMIETSPGQKVDVKVFRDGKEVTLNVTLGTGS